ncbi:hypothetical protein EZS27_017958 [termite gut metagenome]|uniref:Endonuclease GajA/Old nuclease/RecF-like AAA domain-containing protein n=1 Tax=termite gut metagenome TaxID=433724 RepID=A0A5J4RJC5_9ZZZZ
MKIQNIIINKYKAFTKEERIPIEGKNVFVYGENGSGKSSFYYALKDFFQSSVESIDMSALRNFTINDGNSDCSIEVEFDGNIKNILNETTKNTNTPSITDANRLKSFLTYKHLSIHKKINIIFCSNILYYLSQIIFQCFKINVSTQRQPVVFYKSP